MKKSFSTQCIVLRRMPYRETSFLVHTLSRDHGKVDLVVKGCAGNRGKSGKLDVPELFREYAVEYSPEKSRSGSSLHTPSSFELARLHDGVAKNINAYMESCRFVNFLLKNTREEQELQHTFQALSALLTHLAEEEAKGKEEFLADLAFLVYLNENGLLPEMQKEEDAAIFSALLAYGEGEMLQCPPYPEDYPARVHIYLHKLLACHHLSGK